MPGVEIGRKTLIKIISAFLLLLAAGGGSYYLYASRFVSTDDAQVTIDGNPIPLTVSFAGRLSSWDVKINDMVNEGQVIGSESNQSVLEMNPTLVAAIKQNPLLAQQLVEREYIRSPISGMIVQSNVAVGQGVQPGQVLAQVVREDQLVIQANIQETDIRLVRQGQSVDVTIDGLPGQKFKGIVKRIDDVTQSAFSVVPNVTAASGTYTKVVQRIPVIIELKDVHLGPKVLVPGMSAEVKIYVK